LARIRGHARCAACPGGCGWSLNLLRHGNAGLRAWEGIVEVLAAWPTHVVFLTRENLAAQFLSYEVASARRSTMGRLEFRRVAGSQYLCNAFHFSSCSPEQRAWVDGRTHLEVDAKKLRSSILEHERNRNIYRQLETTLRARNISNLTVAHLEYEDLFREATWQNLFRSAGLAGASTPSMHKHSDYSRCISNWDEVQRQALALGYDVTPT